MGKPAALEANQVAYEGTVYTLRKVKVRESDANYDAALNPDGTFNNRLGTRLNLATAIVSPPTTLDDIAEWDTLQLVLILRKYDELNVLPLVRAGDDAGNS